MTTPTIEIVNGDQRISLPVSALVHFDQVVDLAHLCLLSVPVQSREAGAVEAAKQSIAAAAADADPMAALKALASGVKKRNDSDLTAEKLEKGQKPGEDPAKRLLEHVTKCAESLGIKPPADTPIGNIVTAISKVAAERTNTIRLLQENIHAALDQLEAPKSEEQGNAGLFKDLSVIGTLAASFSGLDKATANSVGALHHTLAAFGVDIQPRPDASNSRRIDDASNAIALAGRRGHKLSSKAPA